VVIFTFACCLLSPVINRYSRLNAFVWSSTLAKTILGVAAYLDFAYFSDDFIFYCFDHTLTLLTNARATQSPANMCLEIRESSINLFFINLSSRFARANKLYYHEEKKGFARVSGDVAIKNGVQANVCME